MRVYTPLEQAGRDIYTREGCYACHSQMIRTLRDEVERYGPYSLAVESQYDHPMLWGSKRTGPDLARVGEQVFRRLACRASRRPAGAGAGIGDARTTLSCWTRRSRSRACPGRLAALRRVGVPYTDDDDRERVAPTRSARRCPTATLAEGVVERYGEATNVRAFDGRTDRLTEMDALVAYLQILGGLTDLAAVAEAQAEE